MALYGDLASLGGSEFGFNQNGSLAIYKSSEGFEKGVTEADILRPYGNRNQSRLNRVGVLELLPRVQPRIIGGIYIE